MTGAITRLMSSPTINPKKTPARAFNDFFGVSQSIAITITATPIPTKSLIYSGLISVWSVGVIKILTNKKAAMITTKSARIKYKSIRITSQKI
jgi:hypothetical protein